MGHEIYGTSPLKRHRRSGEQMAGMLDTITSIIDNEDGEITIRHLYYRLVGLNVIPKTEQAYKGLCKHLSKWRRTGQVPYDAFTDSTRWHIKSPTYDGLEDALDTTINTYRRNLWSTQPYYIEIWVEKDSIAGIVSDVADKFGVPVFVCRGFASLSSLYSAANTFRNAIESGKNAIIYHLGDHDPSGVAAAESVARAFRDDFKVPLQFFRVAVTEDQIKDFDLPTRPTKTTDSRAAKWTGGECVELDSMPPTQIRRLVELCITQHIDKHEMGNTQTHRGARAGNTAPDAGRGWQHDHTR